jgi:hypothetical protein
VRWAEGKRKKDWNEHSFHSQKHRWFILDSVPDLGFEDLGAHVEAPFWSCRGSFSVLAKMQRLADEGNDELCRPALNRYRQKPGMTIPSSRRRQIA